MSLPTVRLSFPPPLIVGLLIATVSAAQSVPGPSPPAPLTATPKTSEGPLSLSDDGSIGGLYIADRPQWAHGLKTVPALLDLRRDCPEDVVTGVAVPGLVGSSVFERVDHRPALSGDGTRLVFTEGIAPSGMASGAYRVRLAGRTNALGEITRWDDFDKRSPRPHVSRDGRLAWALHRPGPLMSSGKFFELSSALNDPVTTCELEGFAMGNAQPALSLDATYAVGEWDVRGVDHAVVRMERQATWCAAAPDAPLRRTLAAMPPLIDGSSVGPFGVHDATLSSDGRVAAWTSGYLHCDTGTPEASTYNLWMWYDDGLSPPSFASQTCAGVDGGTLALIGIDQAAGTPSDESFAVLAPSASFLLFVSTANFSNSNVSQKPMLYELDLSASLVEPVPLAATPRITESVGAVALSRDERVVSYTLDRDADATHLGDDFIVVRDVGSQGMSADDPLIPPATEPFDLELLDCRVLGGSAFVDLRLRQWKGGGRALVITAEVDDAVTSEHGDLGPVVQRIGDSQVVDVTLETPFTGTSPTCSARATDGAASHPNVVKGRVAE